MIASTTNMTNVRKLVMLQFIKGIMGADDSNIMFSLVHSYAKLICNVANACCFTASYEFSHFRNSGRVVICWHVLTFLISLPRVRCLYIHLMPCQE